MPDMGKIITELQKLTPKSRDYVLTFFQSRSGNKAADLRVLEADIEIENFSDGPRIKKLFDFMVECDGDEVSKLVRRFR